jgi:hypothetical protein
MAIKGQSDIKKPFKDPSQEYGPATSFAEFKSALGFSANKYTDVQIEEMRLVADQFANAVFDAWLLEHNRA